MKYLMLILLGMPGFARASAWLPREGQAELLNNFRYQDASQSRQYEFNPYYERGFNEAVSWGANFTLRSSVAKEGSGNSDAGFGELFVKHKFASGDFHVLTVGASAGTSGDTMSSNPNQFGYSAKPTAELRLAWGVSSDSHSWGSLFLNSEIAARSFFGEKGNEWRGEESLGYKWDNEHMLLTQLFWTKNWNAELGPRDYDSITIQMTAVAPISENWKLQFGPSTTLSGRRVEYSPVYLLSFWYQWK